MNKLSFEPLNFDGVAINGRLTIDDIVIETPNCFPTIRTTHNPNELELLIAEKGKNFLEHISGTVIRLYNVQNLIEPRTVKLMEEEKHAQRTLEGTMYRSPYANFYHNNLLLCDPSMEYTLINQPDWDRKFYHLTHVPVLRNFFIQYEKGKKVLHNPDKNALQSLRQTMYNDLWFGSNKSLKKDKSEMLTDLTKFQLQHFRVSIPAAHLTITPDDVESNIEINEFCQGLSYQAEKECASYIPFSKSALKNEEVIEKSLEYIKGNKQSKLNIVKFRDLDLHCPVDYKARKSFKNFLVGIVNIKEDQPDRAFMLLDAGTQSYVSLQAFDIISTSLTGSDREISGGKREQGKKYYPLWYDEVKMWPRPTDDMPLPNPDHCSICASTQDFNVDDYVLARRKRIHRLYDLEKDAKALCEAISGKEVGVVMRKRVALAEFSYARDLVLSP